MRTYILIALAVVWVVACTTDSFGPVESEYVLRTVGGEPLPVVAPSGSFEVTVFADTIRFHPDERWSRVTVLTLRDVETQTADQARADTTDGFVTHQDGKIVLDFICEDGLSSAVCVPPDELTRVGATLEIEKSWSVFLLTDLVFEPVPAN